MVFNRLANAVFGRNMTVTIDRASMDRMLDTLGRSVPERDGEQVGLLGVQKGRDGDIAVFEPVPPHSATSHLVSVNHDVLNGFVRHTLSPRGLAVGGMVHTQPNNDSRLSPQDNDAARGFMQSFRNFYKDQTPDYFLAPVMHFDRLRNPQITTWVFDSRNPQSNAFSAQMDVTTTDGRRMEANAYIRMRMANDPNLENAFENPTRSR